jgi:hypothetical protein
MGRYIQPEPLGIAADINLYRYARNNPLRYIDPDGRQATLPGGSGASVGSRLGGLGGFGGQGIAPTRPGSTGVREIDDALGRSKGTGVFASSWEKDLYLHDYGAKREWSSCFDDQDRDCRERLILLKTLYTKIKIGMLLGLNMSGEITAYNLGVDRYHRDCLPYWEKLARIELPH